MIRIGTFRVIESKVSPDKVLVFSDSGEGGEFESGLIHAAIEAGPVVFERVFWENF